MKQMVHLISVSLYRPEWEDSRPWSLFEDTALQDVDKNQPWQEQPLFERLNIEDNLNGVQSPEMRCYWRWKYWAPLRAHSISAWSTTPPCQPVQLYPYIILDSCPRDLIHQTGQFSMLDSCPKWYIIKIIRFSGYQTQYNNDISWSCDFLTALFGRLRLYKFEIMASNINK